MKQKLLLSELELKKLRDRVQHLQNELIRVSWGWGTGERAGGEEGKWGVSRQRGGGGVQRCVWEQKGERIGGKAAWQWKTQRRGLPSPSPPQPSEE